MTDSLKAWDTAIDHIRTAAENEKPTKKLRADLETLDSEAWNELADEAGGEAETASTAAEAMDALAQAMDAVVAMYVGCMLPQEVVDAIEPQCEAFDPDVLGEQVEALQDLAGRYEGAAEMARPYADAIDAASDALEAWEEAEREDKADAREGLVDALAGLVEAHDEVMGFDGWDVLAEPEEEA